MNVSCPECSTVYRVDPAKVPQGGVRARCSTCSGVIPVGMGSDAAAARATPARATPARATPADPVGAAFAPRSTPPRPAPRRSTPPGPYVPATQPPAQDESGTWRAAVTGTPPRPVQPPTPPASPASPAPALGAALPPLRQTPPAQPAVPPQPPTVAHGDRRPVNPFLSRDPGLRARRLARALVSDMVAYYPAKHAEGLEKGTLKELFRDEIRKSYEEYVAQVGAEFARSTTHFQESLNEVLGAGRKIF